MFFLALVSFLACGLYGSADDRDQQLAALNTSMSPPIKVPFSPFQTGRRLVGLPPQLEVMLPAVKCSVVKEVEAHAQGLLSPGRQKALKETVSSKQRSGEEEDIFDFEME